MHDRVNIQKIIYLFNVFIEYLIYKTKYNKNNVINKTTVKLQRYYSLQPTLNRY